MRLLFMRSAIYDTVTLGIYIYIYICICIYMAMYFMVRRPLFNIAGHYGTGWFLPMILILVLGPTFSFSALLTNINTVVVVRF
jgi:hypothetical protein